MKKICSIALLAVFSLASAFAEETKTKESVPSEVPDTMYVFRTHLLALQPYLISEEAFTNQKNEKEVSKHLQALAIFSKNLKKHDRLKTQGFEMTATQLQDHLNRTHEIYKGGNRSFAWWLFRSSIHACNQCHMQVAYKKAPTLQLDEGSISGTAFDQAEFWYAVRQYQRALMFYNSVISRYGMDRTSEQELKASLQRILSICLRIDRSPKRALEVLTVAKDHPQISKLVKAQVDAWIQELQKLSGSSIPDSMTSSVKAIQAYATGTSIEGNGPTALLVSGILMDVVNRRPKEVTPEILFELASSLMTSEKDIFFTAADNYFKTCIEKFPNSPVAKKCFQSLKQKWTDGFTGSAGTNLPEDYQAELLRLESKLKK